MSDGPWWERLPDRLLRDHAAMKALSTAGAIASYAWKRTSDRTITITGTLRLKGRDQAFILTFPDHYPDDCPWVAPDPPARLSSHQFGNGSLCLEIGPDNWYAPAHTAADLVVSAIKLLELETSDPKEIPSRHVVTNTERSTAALDSIFIEPPSFRERLASVADAGVFKVVSGFRGSGWQFWPIELPEGQKIETVPPGLTSRRSGRGAFARLASSAPALPDSISRADFATFLRDHSTTPVDLADDTDVVLVIRDDGTYAAIAPLREHTLRLAVIDARLEGADVRGASLPVGADVAIVGAGSLGSKIAVALARAGVRRFVLLDPDLLYGHNVCRHEGTMLDVGRTKVEILKERITDVASASVEVHALPFGIGDAVSGPLHQILVAAIGATSLVVDATADATVFNTLARISSDAAVPLLWAEVFGGGFGGLIAWAHAAATPCARCVRRALHVQLARLPPAPRAGGAPYVGDGDIPLVATDPDVAFVASTAASLSLALVRGVLPDASPLTLLGLRRAWVFDRPMMSMGWPVLVDDIHCERCWTPAVSSSQGALEQVRSLIGHADNSTDA